MYKTSHLVIAMLALIVASVVHAKEYQSSFGPTLDIPDNWLVLTKQVIQDDPALTNPTSASFGGFNADMIKDLKAKVEAGSLEVFFDRATSDATFADNINVRQGTGKVPDGPDAVKAACDQYAKALARLAKRDLAVTTCEVRTVGARSSFYVEYEGVDAGTVTMQYQIPRRDGRMIYLTATCKRASLDKVRPDFEAIVRSIKFLQPASSVPGTPQGPAAGPAQTATLAGANP